MSAVQLVLSLAAFGTLSEASPCRKSRCPCDRPFHEAVQPRGVRRMPLRACRISAKLHSVPAFLLTNANCIELARMVNFADSSTTLFNDFQHLTLTSQRPWRFSFCSSAEIQTSSITCQLRSTRPVSCDLGEDVADLASSSSLATGCHGSKEIVGSPEVVNELQKTKTKALKMGSNVSCLLFLLFYDGFFRGV